MPRSSPTWPRSWSVRHLQLRRIRAPLPRSVCPVSAGADSEVGRLRTVLLHRPGPELKRLTPRNSDDLLFDAIPWVERAQDEHDAFAETLRARDVEVLYLRDLLMDTLTVAAARDDVIEHSLIDPRLGATLREQVRHHLAGCDVEGLTDILIGG